MVLEIMENRSAGGSTLRMIREGHQQQENGQMGTLQERQKYCYPFKEYDSNGTSTTSSSSNRMSHQNGIRTTAQDPFQRMSGLRRATISQGTGHHHLTYLDSSQGHNQNVPPNLDNNGEPPPLPPKRTTSLMGNGSLSLLRIPKARESSTLNPKRISIATSSFWTGHPDMAHFASGWELGRDSVRTHSVWGTTERGGRPVTESVDIWGDPPAVKKGILLQQREKLWSRWKERYFCLTRDYLNCFRRTTSVHRSGVRLSEMGSFIYKLRLAEVDEIEWETRKNGSLIALVLPQEPRILLRVPDDNYETLHQWYTLLQECVYMSKERRRALRSQHGSTHRSTASYNPSKSVGSASPNSSSKSASNSDLERSDGEKSSLNKHSNNLSIRKSSGGISPKNLLRASTNGKYSPLIDDDEDDYEEAPDGYLQSHNNNETHLSLNPQDTSCNKGDEEFTVTLRRRREINNNNNSISHYNNSNNKNSNGHHPWRLSNGTMGKAEKIYANSKINNNGNINHVKTNNSGYATPIDARPIRPESWTPQPTVFYRTSSLVPSQWVNKRDLPSTNGRGTPFGRSTVMYCPSRITSDVIFRKMS